MFGFKSKKTRLNEKRQKVKGLIQNRGFRKTRLTGIDFTDISENLLDIIIEFGYFSDIYFSDFGLSSNDLAEADSSESSIYDSTTEPVSSIKEESEAYAEKARQEYYTPTSSPDPTSDPDPEPTRTSSSWGSSSWGSDSDSSSSSSSSSSYDSSSSDSSSYD